MPHPSDQDEDCLLNKRVNRLELLRLAGTWSEEEADAFAAAIAPLEQMDADLWNRTVRPIASSMGPCCSVLTPTSIRWLA